MMDIKLVAPELALALGGLVTFGISLSHRRDRLAAWVTAFTALIGLALSLASLWWHGDLFQGALRIDVFSQLFKIFIMLGLASVVLFGRGLRDIGANIRPEYWLLLLLGSLGLMVLVSSVELITLFVALELSSYSLYLLVPLRDEHQGLRIQMEAAAKYVMFGIVASGVLLFGLSYLYGMTGSTYFRDIAPALLQRWADPAAIVGLSLVLLGLFFKLAAFPMHLWAPDVYQGAANETTSFIAGIPKLGAVAVLIRFLLCAQPSDRTLTVFLMVASIGSMFLGNLAALVQKDVKRMLGYSTIAHAGYLLIGLTTLHDSGFAAATFYILAFVPMGLAGFLVLCHVSPDGGNVSLDDLSGLHARSPLAALFMGVSMFALAGIPPFVGFTAKFLLLSEALRMGLVTLVVLAAINTAIGIYYYLTVVRVMYFSDPGDRPAVPLDMVTATVGIVLILIVVLMGVLPSAVFDTALSAVRAAAL